MFDQLWINARLATMREGAGPYGVIDAAALAVENGRIVFAGPLRELPHRNAREIHDAAERWITPGLVDCHTHLVFAGNRADEFEKRLGGASYEEIAEHGGGILSTVRATRGATLENLVAQSLPRLRNLMAEGVTTVEIKSGYGLDLETELKMLRAAKALAERTGVRMQTTFLGLHAMTAEQKKMRAATVEAACGALLGEIKRENLADAVDAFCETIAFTPQETEKFFLAARLAGLKIKLHADQLSDSGGAALAAKFDALSADHLEHASDAGIAAMARAGTVAVLLPGAFYALRETKLPPVDALRRHRVPIAIASDCNPGTSPARSLLAMLSMATTLFRLTPEEALAGVTRNGARALGLQRDIGTLETGKAADFAVWPVAHPAELSYWIGGLRPEAVILRGENLIGRSHEAQGPSGPSH
jgi:imidazolonepropionase